MDQTQLEACRALIEFARDYAEDVFGDESDEASANIARIITHADELQGYLDNN